MTGWILTVISYAAVPVGVFAFVHALLQRSDAFVAVGKLSKPVWLLITAAATLACGFIGLGGVWIIWVAGLVAILVYLVDVRPKLIEVQRRSR
ncbi:MAG: DUF2516 family protein [Sciscionella sp.]|nr:DUF2516 family protein [Sciscionella sp.]